MCGFWKATTAAVGPPVQRQESALGLDWDNERLAQATAQPTKRIDVFSAICSRAAATTDQDAGIELHTDIASTNAADVANGNLVAVGLASSAIEAQLLDRVENCFGE